MRGFCLSAFLMATLVSVPTGKDVKAMEFAVRPNGFPAIVATGTIEQGDSERLVSVVRDARRNNYGLKEIWLDSPGGSVKAALELAKVIESTGMFAVVGDDATCESACATILFISARFRAVIGSGKLGIHSCYSRSSRQPNELCNEQLANFAVAHGTPFGSIMAFANAAGPDQMMWFPKSGADCWSLSRYPDGEEPDGYGLCPLKAINELCGTLDPEVTCRLEK